MQLVPTNIHGRVVEGMKRVENRGGKGGRGGGEGEEEEEKEKKEEGFAMPRVLE